MQVTMTVNGTEVNSDVEPRQLLVHFLRETLGVTGTHWGCDTSNCGTCVVLVDGEPVSLGVTGTHWGCDTSNCGTCVVLVDGEPVKSCTQLAVMTAGHEV